MRLFLKNSFILNKSEKQAFNSVIKGLSDASALAYSQPDSTNYHLVTNSINCAVDAALHQIVERNPIPVD